MIHCYVPIPNPKFFDSGINNGAMPDPQMHRQLQRRRSGGYDDRRGLLLVHSAAHNVQERGHHADAHARPNRT